MKSEAGKVALLDRSVHEGQFGTPGFVQKACQHIADVYRPQSIDELARYELWIVQAITHRIDVLKDKSLRQPGPPPIGDFPLTQPEPNPAGLGVPGPRPGPGIPEGAPATA